MDDESNINRLLIQEVASLRQRISDLTEELRESEEKYQYILENIEDVYFEVDRAGDFTFFNTSLCHILGYTREEMLGTNYKVLMDAENAKKVLQVFSEVYVTGIPAKGLEWEVIKKDSARMYFEVLISLIVKPGEKPTRFRCIAHDITGRKRMEEKLQRTIESLRKAFGVITIQVRVTSKNRGILYEPDVVAACLKLFKEEGYKMED